MEARGLQGLLRLRFLLSLDCSKDIAEVALKLQAAENAERVSDTAGKLLETIDKEIGKLKALVALSLLISATAVILAVLLK